MNKKETLQNRVFAIIISAGIAGTVMVFGSEFAKAYMNGIYFYASIPIAFVIWLYTFVNLRN